MARFEGIELVQDNFIEMMSKRLALDVDRSSIMADVARYSSEDVAAGLKALGSLTLPSPSDATERAEMVEAEERVKSNKPRIRKVRFNGKSKKS